MGMFKSMLSSQGDVSSMRICMFILVLSSVACAVLGIVQGRDLFGLAALVTSMLVPGVGAKAVQSFSEAKGEKDQPQE